jgi:hypothetical protein
MFYHTCLPLFISISFFYSFLSCFNPVCIPLHVPFINICLCNLQHHVFLPVFQVVLACFSQFSFFYLYRTFAHFNPPSLILALLQFSTLWGSAPVAHVVCVKSCVSHVVVCPTTSFVFVSDVVCSMPCVFTVVGPLSCILSCISYVLCLIPYTVCPMLRVLYCVSNVMSVSDVARLFALCRVQAVTTTVPILQMS